MDHSVYCCFTSLSRPPQTSWHFARLLPYSSGETGHQNSWIHQRSQWISGYQYSRWRRESSGWHTHLYRHDESRRRGCSDPEAQGSRFTLPLSNVNAEKCARQQFFCGVWYESHLFFAVMSFPLTWLRLWISSPPKGQEPTAFSSDLRSKTTIAALCDADWRRTIAIANMG